MQLRHIETKANKTAPYAGATSSTTVGAKKVYSVTEAGADEIAAQKETIALVRERVDALRATFRPMPPAVAQALSDPRGALTRRFLQETPGDAAMDAIAAALESATIAIGGN